MKTRASSSASNDWKASPSSAPVSPSTAFRRSGRLIVTTAAGPRRS
jgi:hypothetical protein